MKNPTQVLADVTRRLRNTWHTDLTGHSTSWPHAFPLGAVTKADLEGNFADFQQRVRDWRDYATANHLTLTTTSRRVHGTFQTIPTHLTVPDIDTAARLAEGEWSTRLTRGRQRLARLAEHADNLADPARLLRNIDPYPDLDFDLLLAAADWFHHHTATGLTPRQVPIPGLHAKWLDQHMRDLLTLTGRNTLDLLPRHPARIHFTYLDPYHRAAGGRLHDSATVGDTFSPAYQPRIVVISENKDTAIHFPALRGAIAVEGDGFGGKTAAAFGWLTGSERLYYWGDIDIHGYEILNGWRADGVAVTSILMDLVTYDEYEPFGTNTDKRGNPLTAGDRKDLPRLTPSERAVYERLTDTGWAKHRRIEQERIPLARAYALVSDRALPSASPTAAVR